MARCVGDPPEWVDSVIREATCEYCGEPIIWVRTRRGYAVPLGCDFKPHRLSCPYADRWSRRGRR